MRLRPSIIVEHAMEWGRAGVSDVPENGVFHEIDWRRIGGLNLV